MFTDQRKRECFETTLNSEKQPETTKTEPWKSLHILVTQKRIWIFYFVTSSQSPIRRHKHVDNFQTKTTIFPAQATLFKGSSIIDKKRMFIMQIWRCFRLFWVISNYFHYHCFPWNAQDVLLSVNCFKCVKFSVLFFNSSIWKLRKK